MPGGLLNIVAQGNANIFLTGNPTKTFFKVTYSKYTNFGLQKFRLDFDGARDLRLTEPSTFSFKVKRYAELLMDTYVVINIPDIWSPIYHPCTQTNNQWSSYDFRWIENLGSQMIQEIEITCGNTTLQKYTGEYLACMVERDFSGIKKDLFYNMTGNIPEFNDPANLYNTNVYPSAYYTSNPAGAEPSIRARQLYIPINAWFCLDSRCAFPLIALQYNELVINVTIRPIQELFQVRDVFDMSNNNPYIQPDFNQSQFQMYRFLQTPPAVVIEKSAYQNQTNIWNADIHLIATYCFLSKEESQLFAMQDQVYLVKDVFQYFFENITGSSRVKLTSNGMISNWMWFLQRNDVNLRNEWSNYTNWPYRTLPGNVENAPYTIDPTQVPPGYTIPFGPQLNPNQTNTGYYYTADFNQDNQKEILQTFGILLDGEYRENTQSSGVFNYIEKYTRTPGFAKEGIYCYEFGLNSSVFENQPSGAMNLSRFRNIELELTTYIPQFDVSGSYVNVICNTNGDVIGVTNNPSWRLYQYNYNITVFEERYNVLSFIGGNCGLLYAK
jgi:hypothetical protein